MSARLMTTTLDLERQTVMMTVALQVQGSSHLIPCVATVAALMDRATTDSRPDWNTDDCAEEASALLGMSVTT